MRVNMLSFVSLCLISQVATSPLRKPHITEAVTSNNYVTKNRARGEESTDGTQIGEGWKRDEDSTDGTQIGEGWKREEDSTDGTQIGEGW